MSTITAKEIRDNLADIAKRVQRGEHIQVTYRGNAVFELTPIKPQPPKDRLAGLKAFLAAPVKPSRLDKNKSVKDLYHKHLEEKYGRK